MARVRCEECGHDFFVAYSCRCRVVCPSCSTKRSILLHITFTIPKILRAYFRRNRKLLKFLAQSANYSIERYFTEALGIDGGYTGGIYCIHFSLRSMQALPQGSLFNVHPHTHALVPAGIMKGGVFYEQRNISTSKSPKVLPKKCAQKQRDHPPSSGKTSETVQDMKISPIPTTDNC